MGRLSHGFWRAKRRGKRSWNIYAGKALVLCYLQVTACFVKMPVASLDRASVCIPKEIRSDEHAFWAVLPKGRLCPSGAGCLVVGRFLKQGKPQCGQERHLFCFRNGYPRPLPPPLPQRYRYTRTHSLTWPSSSAPQEERIKGYEWVPWASSG